MTITFQPVIDNAETLSINKLKKVAQTVSRDGVVKSTSLGGQVWEFEVKLPDGPNWTTYRPIIEQLESLDKVTPSLINISKTALLYIYGYKGSYTNLTNTVQVSATSGYTVTITTQPNLQSGYKFKSGDLIQLGTGGHVYSVVEDVPYSSNTITLNRPLRDAAGTYTLLIGGENVRWNVICTQFPRWTIWQYNQIKWSGPFIFSEVV